MLKVISVWQCILCLSYHIGIDCTQNYTVNYTVLEVLTFSPKVWRFVALFCSRSPTDKSADKSGEQAGYNLCCQLFLP